MTRRSLATVSVRLSLTVLSAVLSQLSLPGNSLPLLALVSLVPLGLAIHGASPGEAFVYAYACGFLGWLSSTNGLTIGLSSYVRLSFADAFCLLVALCAYLALPYGLFGLIYGARQWMDDGAGAAKTAACLTLVITFFPTPLPLDSSHALYTFPVLVQTLDLGGQPLLLFILYLFNWSFVDMILRIRSRRSVKPSLALLLAISVFVTAYGWVRLAQCHRAEANLSDDRMISIAVVQPNIPLQGDSDPHSEDFLNPFHTLLEMSNHLLSENSPIDLVVWPETPIKISCENESGTRPQLTAIALRYHVPFLVNCVQPAPNGGDYNTELFISGSGQVSAYHKQRLLPFAEYIPGEKRFPLLRKLMPGASRYVPASGTVVFHINDSLQVVPAICYEVLFPQHTRRFIQKGGNILITSADDAWFGSSSIPDFVLAEVVYQATEYRVPVVRVSNSGNSVAIRASGEIVSNSRLPIFAKRTAIFQIVSPTGRSAYFGLGNAFLYLLTLSWSLGLYWDRHKRRASPR